jgi:hypothetical protein
MHRAARARAVTSDRLGPECSRARNFVCAESLKSLMAPKGS